ncbi:MAG: DNA primase [Clostridia bacterium]|nr:DNA primase [Clostridia bacterium]
MAQDFQDFIDEVRERNDLVEVASEYIKLKRIGNRYAALCPFHNDKKSPSLSIAPDKQLFYCFGCNATGNVIHFIMRMENLEFYDALKFLADRAHLTMPEPGNPADKKKREELADKKQRIYRINTEAARYFFRHLAGDTGKEAYQYLRDRGMQNDTIKKFGLGYAPEGWSNLLDYLKEKGFSNQEVFEAGLAKQRENGSYYDVFHDGRVIFPIINVQGNVIGFGGRVFKGDGGGAKYLNSPETAVFKKKENLFGLNLAKNDKSDSLLLMEGYMDVISLHQAGIGNAVASLGTAFTPEQARLLKKYAGKAILCYDSDQAGKRATLRAGEILTEAEIKTKVMTVTDGKDPDEFIQAKGPEMFQVLMEQAKPFLTYRIDEVKKEYDLDDTEQVIEFLEKAAVILSEIKKPPERELYLKQVAKLAGVSEESLKAQVNNLMRTRTAIEERKREREERRVFEERTGGRRDMDAMRLNNAEEVLLNLMLDGGVMKKVKESGLAAEDFTAGVHRTLAELFWQQDAERGKEINHHELLRQVPENEWTEASRIFTTDKRFADKEKAAQQPVRILLDAKGRKEQARLMEEGDLVALDRMLKQKKK